MANYQDEQFAKIAGQLVANGTGTNMPISALGAGDITGQNIANINGMLQTVKDIFFRETRVFNGNNLDRYFTKWTQRFGGPVEQVDMGYAPQSKLDGTCMPRGSPNIYSQVNAINYAYSVDLDINDYEVDQNVLDEGMAGSYVANKLLTASKTLAWSKFLAEKQIVSNVISGTRSIESTTSTADGGASVTYNPNITGYAGAVGTPGIVVPAVERGSLVTIPDLSSALSILYELQGRAADMAIPADDYNSLKVEGMFTTSTPLLIGETKVLNALDNIFRSADPATSAAVLGQSFRQLASQFSEIVEVDSFASLPTNSTYENKRLGFVLIDRDAPMERIAHPATVETFRCSKARSTGYNWQGSSVLSIARGLNSYAMLFDTQA